MVDFFSNINVQFYILAYIVGSIPFGFLLAKFVAKVDITKSGSGSIGATNVLRVLKSENPQLAKKLSIATMVLDALKGLLVIAIAQHIFDLSIATLWGMAIMSVIGHCYSPFLKFEGGKGVATGFGVLLYMIPFSAVFGFVIWFVAGKLLKISSISSLLGLMAVVISSLFVDISGINSHSPIILIAFIVLYKHIPNIYRLVTKQEGKVI
jgi:glycerol-3-phosphate acyltransferase PlsY